MPRITCIADTHTQHSKLNLLPTDILLHAGDYSYRGRVAEVKSFLEWFSKQPAKHKIFIDGNHDGLSIEEPTLFKEILAEYPNVNYLRHEMIEVEGLKIWGRPTTPLYGNWWHMEPRESPNMLATLNIIPANVDILLTHGPSYGILDENQQGEHCGCNDLLNELNRVKPKVLVTGHIHFSSGIKEVNGIKHINAAVLDDSYNFKNSYIIFDI